jgi:two-component system, chemotaxis family, CheB/CheR fusion protein
MRESDVQDREGRWYRMQIRPYRATDHKIDGAILSFLDIHALKQLVSDAQQARSEAERANRAKDLFLAILGHELRTPLSSLLLRAQMLRRGGAMDSAKVTRVGEAIERATRMQLQLVDDLLDVSRIAAGKLKVEMQAVDLCAIVRAAVEGVSAAAQSKGMQIELVLDELVGGVAGDSARLQQVVSNLLTNAIKFTPDGGRVTVTVSMAAGFARIEVRDTGAGIEPSFLPDVFNRFSQEDSSNTRMHSGLGLGLAIVRHLVEEHGGTVQAASAGAGKGAVFTVTLPLMNVRPVLEQGPISVVSAGLNSPDRRRIKDLRVLVVDDDMATRDAVSDMLTDMGAQVKVAESAAAGMTAVQDFRPRVLLCDIAMPGEDGYSFIRRVRALSLDEGGNTPALALTALAAEDDHRRALAAGFQMHLTKPIDIERLSEAVVELAERRHPPVPVPPER